MLPIYLTICIIIFFTANIPQDFVRETIASNERKKRYGNLIKNGQLIIRSRDYWELRNKHVVVTYDFKKRVMKIFNKHVKGLYSTIIWGEEIQSYYAYDQYVLAQTFRELCATFSDSYTYESVIKGLSLMYDPIETMPKIKHKTKPDDDIIIKPDKKIDVNSAAEDEIASLAGINIVDAKRIIRYRELNHGFKTKEEFYKIGKIKKHFIEKIRFQIEIGEYKITQSILEERTVDF